MSKFDGFISDAESESQLRRTGCGVQTLLEKLAEDDADQVRAALGRADITHQAISRALKRRGLTVSAFTVGRHRRGICSCPEGEQ
ncbi:hypothetical protein [Streptomyces griseus]|uniref:hypothetical protein n=1 Tax=Streptomyces griseus TaxID=1911 RepID=UPI0033D62E63